MLKAFQRIPFVKRIVESLPATPLQEKVDMYR